MSEEAPHIPLEEHIQIDVNQEPPQGQIDESQREQDPARAEAMAYAGDRLRTDAAKERALVNGTKKAISLGDPLAIEFGQFYLDNHYPKADDHEFVAKIYEEWAGILHDHPISEAYRSRFPDVEFEVPDLIALENNVALSELKISNTKKALESVDIAVVLSGGVYTEKYIKEDLESIESLIGSYGAIFGKEQEDEVTKNWESIKGNSTTTIGEVTSFYAEIFRKVNIDPRQNSLNIGKAILDDIKSGRASEQPSHDS